MTTTSSADHLSARTEDSPCNLYLARQLAEMQVSLEDGGHSTPEEVATAAKLIERIFGESGSWIMVSVEPLPTQAPSIDRQTSTGDLYLALAIGEGMQVEIVDGGHSTVQGVITAAELASRISNDERPWLMVRIMDMPDMDPPINEQAADDCAAMINGRTHRAAAGHPDTFLAELGTTTGHAVRQPSIS
jgi:hypothetical protein